MGQYEKVIEVIENKIEVAGALTLKRPKPVGALREKILVFSDLHTPWQRTDLIKKAIIEHPDAHTVVLNGDIMDCYLISVFPKSKEIPVAVEYAEAFALIRWISKKVRRVILVSGNHDYGRFQTQLGKLDPTIRFLMKSSPLEYMADGHEFSDRGKYLGKLDLPNVEYVGTNGKPHWWTKIGKVIFAHRLRGYTAAPMANAVKVAEWFINRGSEFQCLVSAHSHHVGTIPYKGRILIDEGALCYPLEYEQDGRCTHVPMDLGYAIVVIDKSGNVDPDETKVMWLGSYQEKKSNL